MKNKIILIFLFLSVRFGFAGEKFLSAGFNQSTFYDQKSKSRSGFNIQIGKEWQKSQRRYFSLAIEYMYRGARVENKYVYAEEWLSYINANWMVGYLAFPIRWRYMLSNKSSCYIVAGVTPCLSIVDESQKFYIFRRDPGDFPREKADYFPDYDPFIPEFSSSVTDVCFGVGKKFNDFSLELLTRIDILGSADDLHGTLGINGEFITFCLKINYYLERE